MTPTIIAQIEPTNDKYCQFPAHFKTPIGPFFRGTDRYLFWINQNAQSRATKSTDSGLTWVIQDAANVPFVLRAAMRLGDIVYAAHVGPPDYQLFVTPFDLSTDTWGTASAGGPTLVQPLYGFQWNALHTKLRCLHAAGVLIVLSEYDVAGDSWSAPQTVVSSSSLQEVWSCTSDSSGTLHFFYSEASPAGLLSYYVQVAADGTPTAPVELNIHNVGYGAFLGERYVTAGQIGAGLNLGVILVEPYSSTTPSITILDQGYVANQPHVCSDGEKAYIFFHAGYDNRMQVAYLEYDGVTITGPFVWHDQLLTPAPGSATEDPGGLAEPWNIMPPVTCPDLGVTSIFALEVTPSFVYAMFYSENCTASGGGNGGGGPAGGGIAGRNVSMLLLDLSEARATLPDYD